MPDLGGCDFHAQMMQKPHLAKIPVIFVTGKSETESICNDEGRYDVFTKPLDLVALLQRIATILA